MYQFTQISHGAHGNGKNKKQISAVPYVPLSFLILPEKEHPMERVVSRRMIRGAVIFPVNSMDRPMAVPTITADRVIPMASCSSRFLTDSANAVSLAAELWTALEKPGRNRRSRGLAPVRRKMK